MANVTIPYRFVVKRDTAAAFVTANTVLLAGEFGLELDTGRMKMGPGAWKGLPYTSPGLYDLTGLSDGDVLVWDATTSRWLTRQGGASSANYNRMDTSGDIRVTTDGNLRITD